MTAIHRKTQIQNGLRFKNSSRLLAFAAAAILWILFFITLSMKTTNEEESVPSIGQNLMHPSKILKHHERHSFRLPTRIKNLIERNEIIGVNHLAEVKAGNSKVEEALRQKKGTEGDAEEPKEPMSLDEITAFLTNFIHKLHENLLEHREGTFEEIWKVYHDLALSTIVPWDQEYLRRMPERRTDDSIFLSIASFRDENCFDTVRNAYGKAKKPERLYVGLVQQNCEKDCLGGVGAGIKHAGPDPDCHALFCSSPEGKPHCDAGRIRAMHIDESQSLGPYAARFFASKLWYGEQWYMQIDSHMTFIEDWDQICADMLRNAPTAKPVVSHYPPPHTADLKKKSVLPAARLCGPSFSKLDGEGQIVRLEATDYFDKIKLKYPRFAPFAGAGLFMAHSGFLREVPYDPFLPWIFMGEEIIMSARLWTHGYDIYSPTQVVLGHIYVRANKPKFWETVGRVFKHRGIYNPLSLLVLDRIKYQLGYPESSRDMVKPKSVFTALEHYTLGTDRKLHDYMSQIAGLNVTTKQVLDPGWCERDSVTPEFYKQYAHLYKT